MSYKDAPLRVTLSVNIRNRAILKHVILVVTGIFWRMAFSKSEPINPGMVDINTLWFWGHFAQLFRKKNLNKLLINI